MGGFITVTAGNHLSPRRNEYPQCGEIENVDRRAEWEMRTGMKGQERIYMGIDCYPPPNALLFPRV